MVVNLWHECHSGLFVIIEWSTGFAMPALGPGQASESGAGPGWSVWDSPGPTKTVLKVPHSPRPHHLPFSEPCVWTYLFCFLWGQQNYSRSFQFQTCAFQNSLQEETDTFLERLDAPAAELENPACELRVRACCQVRVSPPGCVQRSCM